MTQFFNSFYFLNLLKISILASFLGISSLAFSQQSRKPNTYFGIADKYKEILFFDDFDRASNDWQEGKTIEGKIKIQFGFYNMESLTSHTLLVSKFFPFSGDTIDFEIETKIKFVKGNKQKWNAVFWGKNGTSEKSQGYSFRFSGKGYYSIVKMDNVLTPYLQWAEDKDFKKTGFNKFTVRKANKMYYFFLNQKLVHTANYEHFFGNNFGFQVAPGSLIQIDYIRITQLKK